MKAIPDLKSVRELVELYRAGMLKANAEYQRGIVWNLTQKRKLIDSVFRGYPLPLIYLHHIKKTVAGMQREDLEIIDGQQRINSLHEFSEGAFKLFDPVRDDKVAKFPSFIKNAPCPWAGKSIDDLTPDLRDNFLDTKLSIELIAAEGANEVRDLFVRLQSGLPLNSQETRDAWPGNFTDFILRLGGKPELARYPGHEFFTRTMKLKPGSDRGKTRQLAAQIAMLFLTHRTNGGTYFTDINSPAISEFYYANLGFDSEFTDAVRLKAILDKLSQLILPGHHAKLRGHDAIHLILLVDTLWDDYTKSWEQKLPPALDRFFANLAKAKANKDSTHPDEFWVNYGQWTRVNSDRGDRIALRHKFYLEKMFEYMKPLQLKDPTRAFGELERTIIFFRQKKECEVCGAAVNWDEAEIHHVTEHSQGGQTDLINGALVHRVCHPKSDAPTKAFAKSSLRLIFHRQHWGKLRELSGYSKDQNYWVRRPGADFGDNFSYRNYQTEKYGRRSGLLKL